jgi:hypothetical protein
MDGDLIQIRIQLIWIEKVEPYLFGKLPISFEKDVLFLSAKPLKR